MGNVPDAGIFQNGDATPGSLLPGSKTSALYTESVSITAVDILPALKREAFASNFP